MLKFYKTHLRRTK